MWKTPNFEARVTGFWTLLILFGASANAAPAGLTGILDPGSGNDTGVGGRNHHPSLYTGPPPRPGPDMLYAAPPRAPQLENTGVWKAEPILISGASAYRHGEFLYQDFLYDDHGAEGVVSDPNDPRSSGNTSSGPGGTYTYPNDPVYAANAADIVEFRATLNGDRTWFRVTVNSVLDPERVAFTIALGDSPLPVPFPFGANVQAPARYFLTVAGSTARLTTAAGTTVTPSPSTRLDLERRQFEVAVPFAAWDPGDRIVRVTMGIGLWDVAAGHYRVPGIAADETTPGGAGILTTPPAFFNVAFRYDEPMPNPADNSARTTPAYWRDRLQAQALQDGDISQFHADIDFARLRRNESDDMTGLPHGVPQTGPMNRIVASRFESKQGVDFENTCGNASSCRGALRGQLQPYALYVPEKPVPANGFGFTLLLHSLGANYNQYSSSRNQSQLGERGRGHVIATPAGRGPDGWYVDHAAADTFEVWADVARRYRLDPDMTAISGYSMGGHGTFKFTTRYPDLFARAFTVVGPPALGIWAPPTEATGGTSTNSYYQLEGVRHIPFLMWVQATDELVPYTGTRLQALRFDELRYRYQFDTFHSGEHLTLALHDNYAPGAAFLGDAVVERNPHHVSYVVNPAQDFADADIVSDHAYWLSGLHVRDSNAGRGKVDVVSRGFGRADAVPTAMGVGAGTLTGNLGLQVYESQYRSWNAPGSQPALDRLNITAQNISTMTVHVQRAQVTCNAELDVETDGPLEVVLAACDRSESF